MEKVITEKFKKMCESCKFNYHVEVVKKYLTYALKIIKKGSPEYEEILKSWELLNDRMSI